MGIIINDSITLRSGLSVKDVYASLSGHNIIVAKTLTPPVVNYTAPQWTVTTSYTIWVNKDAATNKQPFLQQDHISVVVNETDNIFQALYNQIKSNFTSTSDA